MNPCAAQRSRILIVDDTPANVEILLGLLEDDYDTRFALSGRQALALLRRIEPPDLILLDVMMPEMDGYAVCAALKGDPRTAAIPVLFITAKTDADSETQALAAGAVDFIHKPINKDVLRARVRLHLQLAQRTAALQRSLAEIEQAQQQLQVLSTAIDQSPTSIIITGLDATIQYVNPCFTEETGYALQEVMGQNPRFLQSGLTDRATFAEMWRCLSRGEPWIGEMINRRKSGEVYWEEAHIAPVKDAGGQITHYVAVKMDITERKRAYERIAYMAHHDALTELPNRALFFERVAHGLALARRRQTRLALLFIDLDRFKAINDRYGHAVGDTVLQEAARRLGACVRESDTLGRLGGDEFVALLLDVGATGNALSVADKINQTLRQPFIVDEKALSLSSSIGVALYPDHGEDPIELAKCADCAMYCAKQSGRDNVKLFQAGMLEMSEISDPEQWSSRPDAGAAENSAALQRNPHHAMQKNAQKE